ncbi:outer membrane biogenesis protein BamB [Botrimarina colliarenosi]|uniref:Outer membrane biogenesis protein BamB n=1 Tax=Botrimarina colliarenosi TaxID=2528001 RepID=A0A5C6A9X3_9BACT|nr:PQQ-binding-like beta-propeller repeat protein [Botrimarina colliarenosi]TWT96118.1 outer membrane biogenesis protein BamB [Botrimarina colliarenosi]
MRFFSIALALFLASAVDAQDWPQWRGPTADNHAAPGATAPVAWSEDSGLAWKTPVPGRGHSSPTLVGDRIYLITADESAQTQSLLIFDRSSGELLREVLTHRGGLAARIHPNNTHASSTVASDGERVFALFCNEDAAIVTAYDLAGDKLWQKRVGGFDPQQFQFGFGSSPRLVDGLLVLSTEYDGPESGLYAVDPATGDTVWSAPRVKELSYSTPSITPVDGEKQLLMSGNYSVSSYDPQSGKELWSVEDITARATCGTMVWDKSLGLGFASGGFPDPFTLAIELGGDHKVVWQNSVKCYEQSLLAADGHVYAASDNGVAYCWRAGDGKEMWKSRLGGKFSSSPLLVGKAIYVTSEQGTTHVFEANPERFVRLGENQLGDSGFATPTPADGRLYHRYGKTEGGKRQEYLVAIGE